MILLLTELTTQRTILETSAWVPLTELSFSGSSDIAWPQ
jgi:hypothetical protein